MNQAKDRPLAGRRIGVLGKGGSGKSTVAILLARALHARGYAVALVDADSTNLGIARALGLQKSPRPLIDHFGGLVFSGGRVTCPVDDPIPLEGAEIDLEEFNPVYVGRTVDGIHLLVAGKMGDRGPGAGCDGPIAKIVRDLRIRARPEEPVTVIDFKAGFEDSARGVLTSIDWVVVVVDPTVAAIQMALHAKEQVRLHRQGAPPAVAHLSDPVKVRSALRAFRHARVRGCLVVLNRVDGSETESYLRARLAEGGAEPAGTFHDCAAIRRAWLWGEPLKEADSEREAARLVETLEEHDRRTPKRPGSPRSRPDASRCRSAGEGRA